jgi:hypothetical protein
MIPAQANRFLREHYRSEFNRRFRVVTRHFAFASDGGQH